MYTAKRVFELQYSRFALLLQLFIFLLILALTYSLLAVWLWLFSLCVMTATWFLGFKQPQIRRFEYLDGQSYSFELSDSAFALQRRKITKIIDHQLYITLYFSDSNYPSCTIWWDQLPHEQWKSLKLCAKLA